MAEELVMNVKSNIKSVTKDTQDWNKVLKETNESIEIQEKVINELDKELIKLKAQQDAIPKGAFYAGMDDLNKKIKTTTTELKLEKNALKGLKQEQKQANKEVSKFNKEQEEANKQLKEGVGSISFMGVSLNSIKDSFGKVGKTAKTAFSTIKAGIMSTGIGALLIALGSLITFFTKTKKGAELLEVTFAGLGAAVNVIVDRVTKFGGAIVKLFQGDAKGALKDVKGAFSGIGEEIANDTRQAIALKKSFQDLRDSQRELNVETAQQRAEIERLKLIAEDTTKSEKERLTAAKEAFQIENDLLDRRVTNAEEAVRIQKEQNKINNSMDADLDALAQREIELANIKAESTTKQIELNNKINSIEKEGAMARQAAEKVRLDGLAAERAALQEIMDLETERLNQQLITASNLLDEFYNSQLDAIDREKNAVIDKWFAVIEAEEKGSAMRIELENAYRQELDDIDEKYAKDDKKEVKDAAKTFKEISDNEVKWAEMTAEEKMNIASSTAATLSTILGEETAAGKAAAIVQATIDTYKGAQAAYASLAGIPVVGPALGGVAAAAAVASGIKNVQAITSAGGGGGGGGGNITAPPTTSEAPPAPQMMSGEFNLAGGVEPEPIKAFVVTDEMTNSQDQLANIRRRATI